MGLVREKLKLAPGELSPLPAKAAVHHAQLLVQNHVGNILLIARILLFSDAANQSPLLSVLCHILRRLVKIGRVVFRYKLQLLRRVFQPLPLIVRIEQMPLAIQYLKTAL